MKKTGYFMHSPIHSGSKGMLQILGVKITQPCKSHQFSKNIQKGLARDVQSEVTLQMDIPSQTLLEISENYTAQ